LRIIAFDGGHLNVKAAHLQVRLDVSEFLQPQTSSHTLALYQINPKHQTRLLWLSASLKSLSAISNPPHGPSVLVPALALASCGQGAGLFFRRFTLQQSAFKILRKGGFSFLLWKFLIPALDVSHSCFGSFSFLLWKFLIPALEVSHSCFGCFLSLLWRSEKPAHCTRVRDVFNRWLEFASQGADLECAVQAQRIGNDGVPPTVLSPLETTHLMSDLGSRLSQI